MDQTRRLTTATLLVIRIGIALNALFLAAVVIGLTASALMGQRFTILLLGAGIDLAERTAGMRLLLLVGLVMALATFVLLRALRDIVASVRSGTPFVAANAGRLHRVGWALLALQLLDLPCALIARGYPSLGDAAPAGGVSLGGWMAVLMVFVLARVFAAGTVMHDELEGTV
ncbi:DUF2975 domain-containing protein [Sphingomonas bacterium]|uniref:DUF2975 domain-containing protein n=1 Tax=Sphingomonas bacterium TaxID=1895847 RepID=UPI00157648A0|nr:DUF2975 domain-containing protein [Sphingomonas bacterium]